MARVLFDKYVIRHEEQRPFYYQLLSSDGNDDLVAESVDAENHSCLEGMNRFTVYTKLDGEPSEEIDVNATSTATARRLAEYMLSDDAGLFLPGHTITGIEERFGLYM
jgi:hypothetical protein